MLTSFFGKSSPVNYLLLSIYLLTVSVLQGIYSDTFEWTITSSMLLGFNAFALLFAMLLVDFFTRKNALTQSNTYAIFCFSTASLLFPVVLEWRVICSLLFVLLGLRRMLSLHSGKNNERKILDASLWFFIASYFYFWNLVWIIPLYVGITSMKNVKFRFFLIPPLTGFGLFLIAMAYFLLLYNSHEWMFQWWAEFSIQFTAYGSLPLIIAITVLFAFFIWSLIFRFGSMSDVPKKNKSNYILIIYVAFTGILAALLDDTKTGVELVLIVPGVALVVAGYLERQMDFWIRELMMWILLLLPILLIYIA